MGETVFSQPDQQDGVASPDESQEYKDQMIAKGEGREPEQKLYAGKYKSEEELQKGTLELAQKLSGGDLESFYKDLEKKMGSGGGEAESSQESSNDDAGEGTADDAGESSGEEEENSGEDEGSEGDEGEEDSIDFGALEQEFIKDGDIGKDSREALNNKGIPNEMIDNYIEGYKAQVELGKQFGYQVVGGKEEFDSMVNWASNKLSKAEIDAYNEKVQSDDFDKRAEAIREMHAKYSKSNPSFVEGDGGNAPTGNSYNTQAEWMADMKDPRYKTDKAFREKVEAKLKRSKF